MGTQRRKRSIQVVISKRVEAYVVEPALIIKGDDAKEDGTLDSKKVEEEESTGGML